MDNRGPSAVFGGVQWGENRYPTLWVNVDGEMFAFPLHRLVAYAHGELEHVRFAVDSREVHHVDGDGWNNRPENLTALPPDEHGRETRRLEARADGGRD